MKSGYLLIILIISIAIIALILLASGSFNTMLGSKDTSGTINYRLNDVEQKIGDYLQDQEAVLLE